MPVPSKVRHPCLTEMGINESHQEGLWDRKPDREQEEQNPAEATGTDEKKGPHVPHWTMLEDGQSAYDEPP